MSPDQAWRELGIGETRDPLEIRRAYTRRLKAIDPDADPLAFIQLREARDVVTHLLWQEDQDRLAPAIGDGPPAEAEAAEVAIAPAPLPTASPPVAVTPLPPEAAAPSPPDPDAQAPIDPALFAAIEHMLFTAPEPPDWRDLREATMTLLANPALDRIREGAAVENWVAGVIANGAPRSDAMLDPAIDRFGWSSDGDDWRRPRILDWILQRRTDLAFETNLLNQQPRYHAILTLLRRPEPPKGRFERLRRSADMRAFLAYAYPRHPTTLAFFDPAALEYWRKYSFEPPSWRRKFDNWRQSWRGDNDAQRLYPNPRQFWAALVVGLVLVAVVIGIATSRPRPGNAPVPGAASTAFSPPESLASLSYQNPDLDMTPSLRMIFGWELTADELARRNPALYGRLVARWDGAVAARETFEAFHRDIAGLIHQAYRAGLRGGDYALQSDYWRLRANILIALRGSEPGACGRYLRGDRDGIPDLPAVLVERERALRVRAIDVARPVAAGVGGGVDIPDAVTRDALRTSGLSLDQYRAALAGNSTDERRCTANIAVIEAALDLPRAEGTAMLRRMTMAD